MRKVVVTLGFLVLLTGCADQLTKTQTVLTLRDVCATLDGAKNLASEAIATATSSGQALPDAALDKVAIASHAGAAICQGPSPTNAIAAMANVAAYTASILAAVNWGK